MRPDIKSLSLAQVEEIFAGWQEPSYRAGQVLDWVYRKQVTNWQEMQNLPLLLRRRLSEALGFATLDLIRTQGAADTTLKFLWRLSDQALIESVLIPANAALYGEGSDRKTLCVSTQVGCAYGCRFCASGLEGWKRNLRPEEIVEQVVAVERWWKTREGGESRQSRVIDNLVIMGMGEPLANYDNLLSALRILNASWGLGLGARKITISTSGLVPEIRRLALEPEQFRLAVSLHGATDEVRSRIMPVNRKYPLRDLISVCEFYQQRKAQIITLEYILIAGINDSLDQARQLGKLAARLRVKINLIPYNTVDGLEWSRPIEQAQEEFLRELRGVGVPATLRREKGHDIAAACGQLRLQTQAPDLTPSVANR